MILLQINFPFPAAYMGEALSRNARTLAESINHEPGFISKVWIENTESEESGGIYLFTDTASAQNYLAMHRTRLATMGVTTLSWKLFHVNQPLSEINRGFPKESS